MATSPIERMSANSGLDLLQSSMRRIQDEIARREQEISTGIRVTRASDDPLAAVRSLGYQANADRADQFLKNIDVATGEMNAADGALGSLGDLASKAKEILLAQVSDTATAETRSNAAIEVGQLLQSAMSVANSKFGGRYLFGGSDGLRAPVDLVGNYAAFNAAAASGPEVHIDQGVSVARAASGTWAFGTMGSGIPGQVDLARRITADTPLADLNRGAGVRAGKIAIDDGAGHTATADLTGCGTVGDVLDRLDDTGLVTATVDAAGTGISLAAAGGGSITVSEAGSGRTAADLGIVVSGGGGLIAGGDLDPRLTLTTPLADLLGGAGIDPAGFTIRNGTYTSTVSLAGCRTVEDLLNAVNGTGTYVTASINGAGDGIDLRSTLSGAELSVAEGSGTTARSLGLVSDFADTPLARLNGGLGVDEATGDAFRITDAAGHTFAVDIAGARTVQDAIDRIDRDPDNPGTVTASVVPGESKIRLDDSSGGTGTLNVESLNGRFAAENLGIAGSASTAGGAIVGTDLRPAGARVDSIFDVLAALRDALATDDRSALALIEPKLDAASSRLLDARADVGARLQRLDGTRTRLEDQKTQLEKLASDDRGADIAESVTEFQRQQMILQATYTITGRILSMSLLDFLS